MVSPFATGWGGKPDLPEPVRREPTNPAHVPQAGTCRNREARYPWTMRIRLPELMERAGLTAHGLSRASGGRISITSAYRLVENRGELKSLEMIEALCDVLGVEPSELLERSPAKPKRTRRG